MSKNTASEAGPLGLQVMSYSLMDCGICSPAKLIAANYRVLVLAVRLLLMDGLQDISKNDFLIFQWNFVLFACSLCRIVPFLV